YTKQQQEFLSCIIPQENGISREEFLSSIIMQTPITPKNPEIESSVLEHIDQRIYHAAEEVSVFAR
ncbi:3272_t:CDS:1, partial [Scutellospora calospora]